MDNKTENLKFWESVETTPPKMTKTITVSKQIRTTVDAQFKKKQITKAFGMYGNGWGVYPTSEKYERVTFGDSTLLHYQAVAFYVIDGKQCEFPIAASIREAYMTQSGYFKVDDEAVKKVRTDALTKGFTDLGFCADIHLGMFDDQAYVEGAAAKSEIEESENREQATKKAMDEINAYCAREIESILSLKSEPAFKGAMKKIKENVSLRCKASGINPTKYLKRLDERAAEKVFEQ